MEKNVEVTGTFSEPHHVPETQSPGGASLGDMWAQCAVLPMHSHWPRAVQNHAFFDT